MLSSPGKYLSSFFLYVFFREAHPVVGSFLLIIPSRQVDSFLLAGHLNLLSEPLRSGSTFPACFAEVPMSPQEAPLGKNLRQLLINSPHHVTLKYYKIKQLNISPMAGLKLLPKLHPLVSSASY